MTSQPNRITVTLTEDQMALYREIEAQTGLSPAQIMQQLAASHAIELVSYQKWLSEQTPAAKFIGRELLRNLGPFKSLTDAMKEVDSIWSKP